MGKVKEAIRFEDSEEIQQLRSDVECLRNIHVSLSNELTRYKASVDWSIREIEFYKARIVELMKENTELKGVKNEK